MDGDEGKAQRYRERAAEMRADAERMSLPVAKHMVLEVAANYEKLANTVEANSRRSARSSKFG